MPLSTQQVAQFRQQALAAGKSPDEIDRYLASKGYAPSGTEKLTSQFAGTSALRATTPSPEIEDPGVTGMLGASLKEGVLGPFAGIAERLKVAESGTRAGIRDEFEQTRQDYLYQDPGALRAIIAGLTEGAANAVPLTPGGAIGRGGAKLATKLGAKAIGSRVAAGAAAGLAEGALVGVGDTVGLEPMDQLKRGALMTLAGGGFGTLGGLKGAKAAQGILKDADPVMGEFLSRYIAENPKRGGILQTAKELGAKIRFHWTDEHAPALDKIQGLLDTAKKAGAPDAEIKALEQELAEASLRANLAKTADSSAMDPVERGTIDPITLEQTGEGLLPILSSIPEVRGVDGPIPREQVMADFVGVGMARHNLELATRAETASVALDVAQDALRDARKRGAKKSEIDVIKREIARAKRNSKIKVTEKSIKDAESALAHADQKYGTSLMSEEEFYREFGFHGRSETHPQYASDVIEGGLVSGDIKRYGQARDYSGRMRGEAGSVLLERISDSHPAVREALDAEGGFIGGHGTTPGREFARIPSDVADPYRWMLDNNPEALGANAADLAMLQFRDWSVRAMIDPLRKVGVFSEQEVADMLKANEWYMPFIRAAEYVEGRQLEYGLGAPKKGKLIHGGLSEEVLMRNPLETASEMAVRVHAFARKQAVRNHMGDFAERYADEIGDEISKAESQHVGDTFRVWRDGELINYRGDKDLVKAIESLSYPEANLISGAAQTATRFFRASATLTPQFSSRNFFKDLFTFAVMSRNTSLGPLSVARSLFGELSKYLGSGRQATDMWKEFERTAAYHSTLLSKDRAGTGVEGAVRLSRDLAGKGTTGRALAEAKRNPLAPLQAFGQFIERLPRFTEYKAGRKGGKSMREAALDAGEATLPFHRAGYLGKKVNMYEAFFNAQMQDVSKFYRAMKSKPFSTSFKGMAWMTLPTLALWARHADDPEYQALPEWEKVLFMHTHKMENGKYFRVPLPPGILGLIFSYFPRKMADHFFGKDPKAIQRLLEETWQQTPLQYIPAPGLNSVGDAVTRAAPNLVQPIVEVMTNRNPFFDRPVMSQRLQGLDPLEQKTRYTTNIAKWTAEAMAKIPGMSQTKAASPGTIEYLLSGYGAGLVRGVSQLSGAEAPDRDMSFAGGFGLESTSPIGFSSQPVQDLYDFSERVGQSWRSLNAQSTSERMKDYLSLHPEAAYNKEVNKVKEQLKAFSKQREAIQLSQLGEYEKENALLAIDQSITMFSAAMMGEFYKAIDRDKKIEQYNEVNP